MMRSSGQGKREKKPTGRRKQQRKCSNKERKWEWETQTGNRLPVDNLPLPVFVNPTQFQVLAAAINRQWKLNLLHGSNWHYLLWLSSIAFWSASSAENVHSHAPFPRGMDWFLDVSPWGRFRRRFQTRSIDGADEVLRVSLARWRRRRDTWRWALARHLPLDGSTAGGVRCPVAAGMGPPRGRLLSSFSLYRFPIRSTEVVWKCEEMSSINVISIGSRCVLGFDWCFSFILSFLLVIVRLGWVIWHFWFFRLSNVGDKRIEAIAAISSEILFPIITFISLYGFSDGFYTNLRNSEDWLPQSKHTHKKKKKKKKEWQ